MKSLRTALWMLIAAMVVAAINAGAADVKKIVLIAGQPSHGPGEHEFRAGVLLLKAGLDKVPGVEATVITNGWPADSGALAGADAIVLYMDGGDGHPAIQENHLAQLKEAMKRGAGLVCLHYAVEVPATNGGPEWLAWLGGYFEMNWSINPTWQAEFKQLPQHPITRGVKPFSTYDEWYYHMRFAPQGVTPILSTVPPEITREKPDGPRSGNQFVRARKGMSEDLAWAYERPDGARGFGLTGGHFHKNWSNDDFRKLVLNAIIWSAKAEVPPDGVTSSLTPHELNQNLDPKAPKKP